MSRINGEKARAAIAKRNRTARREKDRASRAASGQAVANPTESSIDEKKKA
jgi:hypothetical protein